MEPIVKLHKITRCPSQLVRHLMKLMMLFSVFNFFKCFLMLCSSNEHLHCYNLNTVVGQVKGLPYKSQSRTDLTHVNLSCMWNNSLLMALFPDVWSWQACCHYWWCPTPLSLAATTISWSRSFAESHCHDSLLKWFSMSRHFPFLMYSLAQSYFSVLCPPTCWLIAVSSFKNHALNHHLFISHYIWSATPNQRGITFFCSLYWKYGSSIFTVIWYLKLGLLILFFAQLFNPFNTKLLTMHLLVIPCMINFC